MPVAAEAGRAADGAAATTHGQAQCRGREGPHSWSALGVVGHLAQRRAGGPSLLRAALSTQLPSGTRASPHGAPAAPGVCVSVGTGLLEGVPPIPSPGPSADRQAWAEPRPFADPPLGLEAPWPRPPAQGPSTSDADGSAGHAGGCRWTAEETLVPGKEPPGLAGVTMERDRALCPRGLGPGRRQRAVLGRHARQGKGRP